MPIESVANLIQNLPDQVFGQTQSNSVQNNLLGLASSVTPAVAEDTFTPSTAVGSAQATAQDAGLFQFAPGTLTANQTVSPGQHTPGTTSAAGTSQTAGTIKPEANGSIGQSATNAPATQATTSAAAASLQLQIQSLNAALPALGLTNTEINQIDRIASLVQNFNPAAYANLVTQFEGLAQNAGTSTPANSSAVPSTNNASGAATSQNGGGYQVQEASIKFTGSTQPGSSSFAGGGGTNSDGNNMQSNSAGLQIAKVQITLVNSSGQTVQLVAP